MIASLQTDETKRTISLAALLRATTLVAMVLGLPFLLPAVQPDFLRLMIVLTGAVLAAIVGFRRAGTAGRRIRAACAFLGGTVIVAVYVGYAAHVIQNPIDTRHHWRSVDELYAMLPIVVGFPIVIVCALFILRAWVWSAIDRENY